MAKRVKRRIFAGAVCDQIVYTTGDRANAKKAAPRPRFKSEEERAEHRRLIARRHHARVINANYGPTSLYSTLTLDDAHEVHTFDDARKIRDKYYNRLKSAYPEAKLHIYMGRGENTYRIHLHMISDGIPAEKIAALWRQGTVKRIVPLKEHNYYNGVDCGQDYTGLANYLFDHWTPEQGGRNRYKCSKATLKAPQEETPTECAREYSPDRPPIAPKGFEYVRCDFNKYGYMCFHYIRIPKERKRSSTTGQQAGRCEPRKCVKS